jgi:hypothetical protein
LVGYHAADKTGYLLISPIVFGIEITVNTDIANDGSLLVEPTNARGNALPSFSRNEAIALRGDSLEHQVRFNKTNVAALRGKKGCVRVILTKGSVYGMSLRG